MRSSGNYKHVIIIFDIYCLYLAVWNLISI